VPPGNYFISAIVPVLNDDLNSGQTVECVLSTAPTGLVGSQSFGDAILRLGVGAEGDSRGQMPLIGTATFTTTATISVSCGGFNIIAEFPAIMAIKVGTIHL
jgi:hypothetical protein